MRSSALFVVVFSALSVVALPLGNLTTLDKRAIPQSSYDDLVFYFQYASSAYSPACPNPNGNTLVTMINDDFTNTQGFIARDDNRRVIVVSLRGSAQITDFLVDAEIVQLPFVSPGVNAPIGSAVHTGFLTAWNSVANTVITTVRSELASNPGYNLVTSGHSLGGALSSLAAISLQQNFPGSSVRMFTYGQPRTYNAIGAFFINRQFGYNAFRAVHSTDGVPTILPRALGYRHHGVEYFQSPDPASAATTRQCAADGEDPTCSDSVNPPNPFDPAHLTYFNIPSDTPFCT